MLQLNVCAKCFIERFISFLPSAWPIGNGLFDADGFMALRALAEAMTGVIHFVPWSKPPHVGQFWCSHVHSFPQAGADCQPCGFQTAPLPPGQARVRRSDTRECCSGLRRKSDAGAQPWRGSHRDAACRASGDGASAVSTAESTFPAGLPWPSAW